MYFRFSETAAIKLQLVIVLRYIYETNYNVDLEENKIFYWGKLSTVKAKRCIFKISKIVSYFLYFNKTNLLAILIISF